MPSVPLLVACGVTLTVLLLCIGVWLESRALTHPDGYRQPDPDTFQYAETPETEAGLAYDEIAFPVASGEIVRGWLVPAAQAETELAVVALHGRGGDRRGTLGHLRMLHDLGASVLLIDMRENGLSDGQGRGMALGIREAEDASAAALELRRRGFDKVIVFGCSLGGSAAIIAAAQDKSINGVIAESAIAGFDAFVAEVADNRLNRFGVKAEWATRLWGRMVLAVTRWRTGLDAFTAPDAAIGKIGVRPTLLIHGARDSLVSMAHAHALERSSGSNTELWEIDDAGHCDGFGLAAAEYRSRVAALIDQVRAGETVIE